jgi:hypothetical protein
MTERSMYRVLTSHLERLPGAMRETVPPDGEKGLECICSPHSLRATTALSAWKIDQNALVSDAPKYKQVFMKAVVNQPNAHVIPLNFDWKDDQLAVSASRVTVSRQ